MKSVIMEIEGWMGLFTEAFTGETWTDVLRSFDNFQDIGCLLRQVRQMGTPQDQTGIVSFEEFVDKWYAGSVTKEDFASCRAALSIGHLCCISASDENGAVEFAPFKQS